MGRKRKWIWQHRLILASCNYNSSGAGRPEIIQTHQIHLSGETSDFFVFSSVVAERFQKWENPLLSTGQDGPKGHEEMTSLRNVGKGWIWNHPPLRKGARGLQSVGAPLEGVWPPHGGASFPCSQ